MHCTGQFDTRSAIGLCKAIEPIDPMWIEDPLQVRYSEDWLGLKRSTRVPLLAGGVIGVVVDASNGAQLDHDPNPVIAHLKPLGSVSPMIENRQRRKRAPVS